MRKIYLIFLPFLLLFLYGCPQTYTSDDFIATKTTLRQSNLIGVVGENTGKPYIEIEYTKYENGKNVTKTELLSPPFLIGDNPVQITYDSLVLAVSGKKTDKGIRRIKPDYNKDGSHYLKITNRSDKAIEYFVVGVQPMTYQKNASIDGLVVKDGYDLNRFIETHPVPIYNDAPVYYLLFPDKRPSADGFIRRITKFTQNGGGTSADEIIVKRIKFTGGYCGDIQLTAPWTVEQAMNLYRDEYTKKPNGQIMYMNYNDADPTTNARLSELTAKFPYQTNKTSIIYDKIAPKSFLQNTGNIWLINTPYLSYGVVNDEF
ncbi:MAG: hypothetical protein H6Q18_172 [Bacteroidetes bacterium]|nr:hypothetical protein [Bacteroidota bacterium]